MTSQDSSKKATRNQIDGWITKTNDNIKNHEAERKNILDMIKKIPGSEKRMKRAIEIIDQTIANDKKKILEYQKLKEEYEKAGYI